MMDREERNLELSLESMSSKLVDVKNSLSHLLLRLESLELIDWPSFLDSFALLSSQLSLVMRVLCQENLSQLLRNRVLLPLLLTPDRDDQLAQLTQQRLVCFSHDTVPSYLRTKQEPEVEGQERQIQGRAGMTDMKTLNQNNRLVSQLLDSIKSFKDERDSNLNERSNLETVSSKTDTLTILAATTCGRGLKPETIVKPTQQPQPQTTVKSSGKAPPTIKTNIRTNPYSRN